MVPSRVPRASLIRITPRKSESGIAKSLSQEEIADISEVVLE
jgi:hypothetical protein